MAMKNDTFPFFPEYFENYLKPKIEEKILDNYNNELSKKRPWYEGLRGTSLEGFGLLFRDKENFKVKLFWITAISTCFITSVFLLLLSFRWNSETPTVTVIDTLYNPVWNHHFPAVTICNTNRISLSAATKLASKL